MALQEFERFGLKFTSGTAEDVAARLISVAVNRAGAEVHLCTTHTISLLHSDSRIAAALESADFNLPDGWPVARLAPSGQSRRPIRGADLFRAVLGNQQSPPLKHFFIGGDVEHPERLTTAIQEQFPHCSIAGVDSGFVDVDQPTCIERLKSQIEACRPDIVWIGLGTPKQDHLVRILADIFPTLVLIPVGAVFDFVQGNVTEAPLALRGSGFEWLHRFFNSPARLGPRYLVGGLTFLRYVIKDAKR